MLSSNTPLFCLGLFVITDCLSAEREDKLWLFAASVSALAIPYQLLIMVPAMQVYIPTAGGPHRPSALNGSGGGMSTKPHTIASDDGDIAAQRHVNFESVAEMEEFPGADLPEARRLMHVKSGRFISFVGLNIFEMAAN